MPGMHSRSLHYKTLHNISGKSDYHIAMLHLYNNVQNEKRLRM